MLEEKYEGGYIEDQIPYDGPIGGGGTNPKPKPDSELPIGGGDNK